MTTVFPVRAIVALVIHSEYRWQASIPRRLTMYLPRNPVAPKTVTVCPRKRQQIVCSGECRENMPPREDLLNGMISYANCAPGVVFAYLPPAVLMIGLPVRVIATSCRPRRWSALLGDVRTVRAKDRAETAPVRLKWLCTPMWDFAVKGATVRRVQLSLPRCSAERIAVSECYSLQLTSKLEMRRSSGSLGASVCARAFTSSRRLMLRRHVASQPAT
jgi:hypothetical protein